jgi:hypothetical protein
MADITPISTLQEAAAIVSSSLERAGIVAILFGGETVSL